MTPLVACLSLLCLALGSSAQGTSERGLPPASPCPAVYSYGWDPSGGWHGIITILPPARFSEVQLVLRMTVPYYRPEAGVGRVEVKGGTPEIQAISRRAFRGERHKIQFMIIFPPFDDIPRVKEIFFNGKSFCVANQVYADTRSTIELKYTLRSGLNMPLANGNDFSVVSAAPSKPDLVTVAILRPTDEARPTVSSPQSPPQRPVSPGTKYPPRPEKPPCKCNKTRDDDEEDFPMQHRPDNHVFHAFTPPRPSDGDPQHEQDDRPRPVGSDENYAPPPPDASVNRPSNGIKPSRPFAPPSPVSANRPSNGITPSRPFAPPPPASANRPSNGNTPSKPFAPPPPASANRPSNSRPSLGDNQYAPPTSSPGISPGVSHKNEEVDDKIYFIMTDSDQVDSPRIVKLLEHLLIISKKHYQVDLERLQIEKKRLALQKFPHYTFVV